MATKMTFVEASKELLLPEGEYDSSTSLATSVKGKLLQSNGNFEGRDFDEGADILPNGGNVIFDTGILGGSYNRYAQANITTVGAKGAGKDGSRYAYLIHRAPDITSTSTWGGVRLYPPDAAQRLSNNKFRISFDYRGYSGGFTVDVYPAREVGWTTLGVNLVRPYNVSSISAFDSDWEWRHYEATFTVEDQYLNYVAGAYDWNNTTQYPASGDYGIRYNGDLYRKRNARPAPTIGIDPLTEYTNDPTNGPYDVRFVGGAAPGYFNLYDQFKIGFTYQAQNARGTHMYVDNIYFTNITTNERFKYNLANEAWETENLSEGSLTVLAKGTAYVAQARSDTGTDIFAVEGSRVLTINGTNVYTASGRGLRLTVFNYAGTVSSDTTYDVYGLTAARNDLATALAGLTTGQYWVLTSFDAIGTESNYNTDSNLRNQLISMGSELWNPDEPLYMWSTNAADVRNPYAALGNGQKLLKEDGAGASDALYKRKGVIDLRL